MIGISQRFPQITTVVEGEEIQKPGVQCEEIDIHGAGGVRSCDVSSTFILEKELLSL